MHVAIRNAVIEAFIVKLQVSYASWGQALTIALYQRTMSGQWIIELLDLMLYKRETTVYTLFKSQMCD